LAQAQDYTPDTAFPLFRFNLIVIVQTLTQQSVMSTTVLRRPAGRAASPGHRVCSAEPSESSSETETMAIKKCPPARGYFAPASHVITVMVVVATAVATATGLELLWSPATLAKRSSVSHISSVLGSSKFQMPHGAASSLPDSWVAAAIFCWCLLSLAVLRSDAADMQLENEKKRKAA